mmetsp:Transcript_11566/g.22082  ORF Transcript_11566/g.22082 Transcript_11566/m.22082 type:complete len:496 (+) Transcript_11566:334-1821(+)
MEQKKAAGAGFGEKFPAGMKVMVVDDDPLCLKMVESLLKRCSYNVTTCSSAAEALTNLRVQENFDLVLSDVYMPDMDGFKLLETIGLEMDMPVIMMSANADTSVVLRGITHGAEDYLLKPVRIEELRNLWQHVVRRRCLLKEVPTSAAKVSQNDDEEASRLLKAGPLNSKRRKTEDDKEVPKRVSIDMDDEEEEGGDNSNASKKPRVIWSVELHQEFVNAVNQLGIDKAVPKRILDLMDVSGLTRENVASHLQKYRLYLKRLNGAEHSNAAALVKASGFPIVYDPNTLNSIGMKGFGNQASVSGMQSNFASAMHNQPPMQGGMGNMNTVDVSGNSISLIMPFVGDVNSMGLSNMNATPQLTNQGFHPNMMLQQNQTLNVGMINSMNSMGSNINTSGNRRPQANNITSNMNNINNINNNQMFAQQQPNQLSSSMNASDDLLMELDIASAHELLVKQARCGALQFSRQHNKHIRQFFCFATAVRVAYFGRVVGKAAG